jgi:hypothetical protein
VWQWAERVAAITQHRIATCEHCQDPIPAWGTLVRCKHCAKDASSIGAGAKGVFCLKCYDSVDQKKIRHFSVHPRGPANYWSVVTSTWDYQPGFAAEGARTCIGLCGKREFQQSAPDSRQPALAACDALCPSDHAS